MQLYVGTLVHWRSRREKKKQVRTKDSFAQQGSLARDKERTKLDAFRHILHQLQQNAAGAGGVNKDVKVSAGADLDFL